MDHPLSFSFEFFPPKTKNGAEKLYAAVGRLAGLRPEFMSVTCGAGGSSTAGTFETVQHIRKVFSLNAIPHITIWGQSRARLRQLMRDYRDLGVKNAVTIRGDISQTPEVTDPADLYPNTVDLVTDLAANFKIAPFAAAYPDVHPQALSPQQDLDHLKRKIDAGAVLAITQFFFLPEIFFRFRDRVEAMGIKVPLVPGIMPVHNVAQTIKFAKDCGAIVPPGFAERFERHGTDEAARFKEGADQALALCSNLRRGGVKSFHFYALNRSEMVQAICEGLGATSGR